MTARRHVGRRTRCRACGHVQVVPNALGPPPAEPGTYALAEVPAPPAQVEESASSRERHDTWAGLVRSTILGTGRLQGASLALLVCSGADLLVTASLLHRHPAFYESNPVAHWFFARWNLAGMVLFKFSLVGLAIALSELIERRRPGWGKVILWLGCAGALYALSKGLRLYLGFDGLPASGGD